MRNKAKNIATALLLIAAVVFIVFGISSPPIAAKKASVKQNHETARAKTIASKKSVQKQQEGKPMSKDKAGTAHRYFHKPIQDYWPVVVGLIFIMVVVIIRFGLLNDIFIRKDN